MFAVSRVFEVLIPLKNALRGRCFWGKARPCQASATTHEGFVVNHRLVNEMEMQTISRLGYQFAGNNIYSTSNVEIYKFKQHISEKCKSLADKCKNNENALHNMPERCEFHILSCLDFRVCLSGHDRESRLEQVT